MSGDTCTYKKYRNAHTQPKACFPNKHLICIFFVFKEATCLQSCHCVFLLPSKALIFGPCCCFVKCGANVLPIYRRMVGEANPSKCRNITQLLQKAQFNSRFQLEEGVLRSHTSDSCCSRWRHSSTLTRFQFHNTCLQHLLKFRQ